MRRGTLARIDQGPRAGRGFDTLWKAKEFWTYEPQSSLLEDVPEYVGDYCRRRGLKLTDAEWRQVSKALVAADAAMEEDEDAGAAAAALTALAAISGY